MIIFTNETRSTYSQTPTLSVLTVSYPGGKTQQMSLRLDQVAKVRRWVRNYQKLKEAIEAICELNHELLRAEKDASKAERKEP